MKFVRFIPVLLLFALSSGTTAAAGVVSVNIVDAPRPQEKWGYAPASRTVQPGTWVTWSNGGGDAHTVTAVDGSFDSGELAPSEGFSWFFDQPGTYEYICTLHPWMKARIVVGGGASATSSASASAPAPAAPDDEQAPAEDDAGSD